MVVVAAPLLWLGVRSFIAYDALMNLQSRIEDMKSNLIGVTSSPLPYFVDDIRANADLAASMMSDPVWHAAESVPFVGKNMAVIREVTLTLQDFVIDGAEPLAARAGDLDVESFRPDDGSFDMRQIESVVPVISDLVSELRLTQSRLEDIDLEGTLGPVRSAVASADAQLRSVVVLADRGMAVLDLLPSMLGSDGERTYLVVVLDSSIDRAIGGRLQSVLELSLSDGAITVATAVPWESSLESTTESELDRLARHPDFAEFARALASTESDGGDQAVSGVVAIDSVALSSLLTATGPVQIDDGDLVDGELALSTLVTGATSSASDRAVISSQLLTAAVAAFSNGVGSTGRYLDAASQMLSERRFQLWLAEPAEEDIILETPFHGTLPESNDEVTTYGVFLNQVSAEPIATHLSASVVLRNPGCAADHSIARLETEISVENVGDRIDLLFLSPVGGELGEVVLNGTVHRFDSTMQINNRFLGQLQVDVPAGGSIDLELQIRVPNDASRTSEIRTNSRWQVTELDLRSC